jgi:uncharacterized protein YbdZ (MbtH family)
MILSASSVFGQWIYCGTDICQQSTSSKVGVGTASPQTMLHLYQSAAAVELLRLDNPFVASETANKISFHQGANEDAYIDSHYDPANGWAMRFGTRNGGNNAADRMIITNNGYVGIGTTTPGDLLTVNGPGPVRIKLFDSTSNVDTRLFSQSSGGYVGTASANSFGIVTNNSAKVTVDTAGNMGIGTATPIRKLDVAGSGNDGLTIGQQTDNVQAIQTYIDGHWTDRATYAGGCCTGLLIEPDAGWVAIGTASPTGAYKLEVAGQIYSTGGYRFPDNTVQTTASAGWVRNSSANQVTLAAASDQVGIGTAMSNRKLDVSDTYDGLTMGRPSDNIQAIQTYIDGHWTDRATYASTCPACNILALEPDAGIVGIGTTTPNGSYKLDIAGSTHVSNDLNVGGNITGGTVRATYQDVAEWVPASEQMMPGTVVVVSKVSGNTVMPSSSPYDTRVAGVVSLAPGVLLGVEDSSKAKIATTGRVKVRADATNGPIEMGDLLVTSGKTGVAMKSEPLDLGGVKIHRPGTIIGKALEPLPNGQGDILVLLSLQ